MFYLIVSLSILAYAIYKAAQKDFTYGHGDTDINPDKLMPYILATMLAVLAWPIVIPMVGIYKLGERFKKEV
jgi:hypothetical protein